MGLEIEAKLKVEDHARIRERLHECGAEHVGEFFETNTFFDTPDRSLRQADCGLRLREEQNLASNEHRVIFTYKGPHQQGPLKSREEVELQVKSAGDAIDFMRCLNFAPTISFQKKRQSWKLDNCKVELDEVPYLGLYVEVEGPGDDDVMRVLNQLGLAGRTIIKSSYAGMLAESLEKRGIADRSITFENASRP